MSERTDVRACEEASCFDPAEENRQFVFLWIYGSAYGILILLQFRYKHEESQRYDKNTVRLPRQYLYKTREALKTLGF